MSDVSDQRRYYERMMDDIAAEHQRQVDQIKAENAKLRELCRRFAGYVGQDRCEGCVYKRRCNDGEVEECWQRAEIREMANELGIEVE